MTTTSTDPIAARFDRKGANHALIIAHDDGLYRHLKFRGTTDWAYWYDLITVPGSLIFRGDGESYVFHRIEDMFAFFRSNPDRATRRISPDYWAEKLTSSRDAVKTYSREVLDQLVAEHLEQAEAEFPGVTEEWKFETEDSIDYDLDYEDSAREALRDFEYRAEGSDVAFRFSDTWEWDLKDFDWWYLWACHAIVAGIAKYDAAKKAAATAAPDEDTPTAGHSRPLTAERAPGDSGPALPPENPPTAPAAPPTETRDDETGSEAAR